MFFHETILNPDCVRFRDANNTNDNIFAASFYNLAQDNVTYSGGLSIFELIEGNQFQSTAKIDMSAIFDFQWMSADKLICANVEKRLDIVHYQNTDLSIASSITLNQKPLHIDLDQNSAFVSEENGYVSIVEFENGEAESHKLHTDNVWMVRKNVYRNILISGSDDCHLTVFDLTEKKSIKKFRPIKSEKESGITSIQIDTTDPENIFFIGTYEKQLQAFDMRNLAKPIGAAELPGGVWRMSQCGSVLACGLSYGKSYELVDVMEDYSFVSRGNFQGEHDSLLYGIDVRKEVNGYRVISCSFYDRKIACNTILGN
jgi:hypothetical protein